MFLYGLGLNLTVNSNADYRNGTAMFNLVKHKRFEGKYSTFTGNDPIIDHIIRSCITSYYIGMTGTVIMDSNSERISQYIVYSRDKTKELVPLATLNYSSDDGTYVSRRFY